MDIIPLNNKKAAASTPAEKRLENPDLIQNAEGNENAKPSLHVYPVTVPDEATGIFFFCHKVQTGDFCLKRISLVQILLL